MCTFCALDEPVDLRDGDNMSEHVAEPLRINEVEVAQGWCVIVKHDACRVEEGDMYKTTFIIKISFFLISQCILFIKQNILHKTLPSTIHGWLHIH